MSRPVPADWPATGRRVTVEPANRVGPVPVATAAPFPRDSVLLISVPPVACLRTSRTVYSRRPS